MKNTLNRPLLKTALFSAFALACVTALAQNGLPLVFTELPGDGLMVTLGFGGSQIGSPPTLVSAPGAPVQIWDWSPPAGAVLSGTPFGGLPGAQWLEPPPQTPAPEVNEVLLNAATAANGFGLEIESDVGLNRDLNLPPYGNTDLGPQFQMTFPGGVVDGMAFIDNGDGPQTVADGGLTLAMLGTAMVGLALVGRKFQVSELGALRQAGSETVC